HLGQTLGVDAADGEPGEGRVRVGGGADQVHTGGLAAGFGGGRPDRAGAEVVDVAVDGGQPGLGAVVGRAADHHVGAEDAARVGGRQIALAKVQHVDARGQRDVGAVVRGDQPAVSACDGFE